ncbi:MAG: EscU/YscU/HrcU family type III secretion system export apparatus switch protein [Exilispira sp.]
MDETERKRLSKKTCALKYNSDEPAPRLISKGKGMDAEKIIEEASRNGIPVISDDNLADNLYRLQINEFIPEELFEIIAAIYSYVMKKKENRNEKED